MVDRPPTFEERSYVNATTVRDRNPDAHVLCTLNGVWSPMRVVAFGDLLVDSEASIPLVFNDAFAAEARAQAWNDRLPEQYRSTLDICSMPIARWHALYTGMLDDKQLWADHPEVEWVPQDFGYVHPEAACACEDYDHGLETV